MAKVPPVQLVLDDSKLIAQAEVIASAFADMGALCLEISASLNERILELKELSE